MASASTVDGLISGLSTSSIIKQLIDIEKAPQTALIGRQSSAKSAATYYRAVNTRFDALRSAAEALTKPDAFQGVKTSSSSSSVAVSATASAPAGTISFQVTKLATRHSVLSDTTWTAQSDAFTTPAAGTNPGSAGTLTLTKADGTTASVDSSGTLAETVAAINSGSFAVTAAAVQVGPSAYRLQLTAKDSGSATTFTATTGADDFAIVDQGGNAELTVGSLASYTVTSPTNTFTGVLDGVTLTVNEKTTTPVTVAVSSDPAAVAAKVKTLVDAANEALKTVTDYTDPKNKDALLRGDNDVRQLATRVLDAVSSGIGGRSAGEVGIQLTRTGTLTFDAAKFTTALAADPGLAKRILTGSPAADAVPAVVDSNGVETTPAVPAKPAVDGLAARLLAVAKTASDPTTGSLTRTAQAKDADVKDYQTRIDAWDVRLALKQTQLEKYYTNLETALGALKNQSSWLAGQLANLPTWSR